MHCSTLVLAALCVLFVIVNQGDAVQSTPLATTAPNNFARELKSLLRAVPKKQIRHLVQAYVLNDAEFQGLIRSINSVPAYRLRQQLLNQPEVRQLRLWLVQQLLQSGGSAEVFDDLEISLFNKYPHWAQTTQGVSGFQREFLNMYPSELVRSLMESTAKQSAVFGEFWRRLVALKPVYERFVVQPASKTLIAKLRQQGVDIEGADRFIRYQLGWSNATWYGSDYDYNDYLGGA